MGAEAIHLLGLPKKHTYADIVGALDRDLDLGVFDIIQDNWRLKDDTTIVSLRNRLDTDYMPFRCKGFYALGNFEVWGSANYMASGAHIRHRYEHIFDSWNGAAYAEYARVYTGADYRLAISRLGNLTFLAGKKFLSDVLIDDTKKLLWSDVNLYRSAANVLKTDDIFEGAVDIVAGTKMHVGTVLHLGGWNADVNLYRSAANVLKTDDLLDAVLGFQVNGVAGVDGSFTSADGKTVTVTKGIITSIV